MEAVDLAPGLGDWAAAGRAGVLAAAWASVKRTRAYDAIRSAKARIGYFVRERGLHDTGGVVRHDELGLPEPEYVGYEPSNWRWLSRALRGRRIGPDDVFVDLGSGKGRILLAAARYPFGRVIGVELAESLNEVAKANVDAARGKLRAGEVEIVTADITKWRWPPDVNYVYLFNPVEGPPFSRVVDNLMTSLRQHPRRMTLIYANPTMASVIERTGAFELVDVIRNPLRPDIGPSGWASVYEAVPSA
jgi:SAM-dependent methyltransferase